MKRLLDHSIWQGAEDGLKDPPCAFGGLEQRDGAWEFFSILPAVNRTGTAHGIQERRGRGYAQE